MLPGREPIKRRWIPVSLLVFVVAGALFGAASAYGDGSTTVMTQNLYQGARRTRGSCGDHADIRTGSRRHDG